MVELSIYIILVLIQVLIAGFFLKSFRPKILDIILFPVIGLLLAWLTSIPFLHLCNSGHYSLGMILLPVACFGLRKVASFRAAKIAFGFLLVSNMGAHYFYNRLVHLENYTGNIEYSEYQARISRSIQKKTLEKFHEIQSELDLSQIPVGKPLIDLLGGNTLLGLFSKEELCLDQQVIIKESPLSFLGVYPLIKRPPLCIVLKKTPGGPVFEYQENLKFSK